MNRLIDEVEVFYKGEKVDFPSVMYLNCGNCDQVIKKNHPCRTVEAQIPQDGKKIVGFLCQRCHQKWVDIKKKREAPPPYKKKEKE